MGSAEQSLDTTASSEPPSTDGDIEDAPIVILDDDWLSVEVPVDAPWHRLRRVVSPAVGHLGSALVDVRAELEAESTRNRRNHPVWLDRAGQHYVEAVTAWHAGRFDDGWRALRHVHRLSLEGATEVGIHARILTLKAEAGVAISGWTATAVIDLLDEAAINPEPVERRELLTRAISLRDRSLIDTHHQHAQCRREISWSCLIVAVAVSLLVVASLRNWVRLDGGAPVDVDGWTAASVVLFGLIGAGVSAVSRVAAATSEPHDAERRQQASPLLRPFVGAGAALVVGLAIAGGVIGPLEPTAPLVMVVAFAAGFAERLAPA